jgi:hypothetical protein
MKKYSIKSDKLPINPEIAIRKFIFLSSLVAMIAVSAIIIGIYNYNKIPKTIPSLDKTTSINLLIPNDFYISYFADDNSTLIFRNNFTIYLIMLSGNEFENETMSDMHHIQHFIDPKLLAEFLDIDMYNLTWFENEFILNGRNLSLSFTEINNNTHFRIGACDFSMFNETINYHSLDFGNSYFMNFTLGESHNIRINGIECYPIGLNEYRPFLSYTIKNQTYYERMAWNNTLFI